MYGEATAQKRRFSKRKDIAHFMETLWNQQHNIMHKVQPMQRGAQFNDKQHSACNTKKKKKIKGAQMLFGDFSRLINEREKRSYLIQIRLRWGRCVE